MMGDLYASAIGTTVLQLKEIPPCPPAYVGALYVGMLDPGIDKAQLQTMMSAFGPIAEGGCSLLPKYLNKGELVSNGIVRFQSHLNAKQAVKADASQFGPKAFFTLHYNELNYDHRGW